MRFNVRLEAFQEGKIRVVDVPDNHVVFLPENAGNDAALLDAIFFYGQNDVQSIDDRVSVSAGDVIELPDGHEYRVAGCGFTKVR